MPPPIPTPPGFTLLPEWSLKKHGWATGDAIYFQCTICRTILFSKHSTSCPCGNLTITPQTKVANNPGWVLALARDPGAKPPPPHTALVRRLEGATPRASLCTRCGFHLDGLPLTNNVIICPECGQAVAFELPPPGAGL